LDLHSFPTRRSSDLDICAIIAASIIIHVIQYHEVTVPDVIRIISRSKIPFKLVGCPVIVQQHRLVMVMVSDDLENGQFEALYFRSEEHTSELQSREN